MKKLFTSLSAVFLLAICTQGLYATTWYVKLTGSPAWADKNPAQVKEVDASGTNPKTIFGVLQNIVAGDVVWVASGTYELNSMLAMKANVTIVGGFAGTENAVSERVLSDMDGNGLVEPWEFANPVVIEPSAAVAATPNQRAIVFNSASTNAVVDGFIFQNYHHKAEGTAVVFINNQPTGKIRNTVLRNSSIALDASNTAFINGVFTVNSGEAVNCLVEFCTVEQTNPAQGGADGVFRVLGQNGGTSGRAIGCVARGNKVISVRENQGRGGGFAVASHNNSTTSAVLINSIAYNNYSSSEGGGIVLFHARDSVINCTAVNNVSGNNKGAGIAVSTGSYMYNTVAWGNTGKDDTATDIAFMNAGSNVYKVDNISGNHFNNETGWSEANFSGLTTVVELTKAVGVLIGERPSNTVDNGTDLAPRFTAPTAFQGLSSTNGVDGELTTADAAAIRTAKWTLEPGSPLINKGSATHVSVATDLMGAQRVQKGAPDMGALESDYILTGTTSGSNFEFAVAKSGNEIRLSGIDGRFEVSVFDLNGKLIQTGSFHENAVVQFPGKGICVLRIVNTEFSKTVKIVL